jgi:hypothetical protein
MTTGGYLPRGMKSAKPETKPCPWCDYDLSGLEGRVRRCPECGRRPYRRTPGDFAREQFWPPYESRPGPKNNAEVTMRRTVTILVLVEIVLGMAWVGWMFFS